MKIKKIFIQRRLNKPWGYEYTVYDDLDKIGITFLNIKYNHKTSLHCHPNKKLDLLY